jgi:hypothetical protein
MSRPASVNVTTLFILLDALLWLAFAILTSLGVIGSITELGSMRWLMAFLALVSAAGLGALAHLLRKGNRLAFYLAVVLLTIIAVLSVTDQVGLLDLLALLINLIPLVLLLKDRAWYLGGGTGGVVTK